MSNVASQEMISTMAIKDVADEKDLATFYEVAIGVAGTVPEFSQADGGGVTV